jgi:signal transduction histidine kinase
MKNPGLRIICVGLLCLLSCCKRNTQPIIYHSYYKTVVAKAIEIGAHNTDSEIAYINAAYKNALRPANGDLLDKYDALTQCYLATGNNAGAHKYIDSSLAVLKCCNNDPQYELLNAKVNNAKGVVLVAEKKYDEAFRIFYMVRATLKDKNTCESHFLLSGISGKLGSISYTQHRYADAAQMFKESVSALWDCNSKFDYFARMQSNLNNTGLSFAHNNQPDSAIKYYNKAIAFVEQNQSKYADKDTIITSVQGMIYDNRAQAYDILHQYQLAKTDYIKSIRINSRKGFSDGDACYATLGLAAVYLKTHQPDSIKTLLAAIGAYMKKEPADTIAHMRYLRLNADYLKQTGKFKEAYNSLALYSKAKADEQLTASNLNKIDFNKDFEVLAQKYKVISLSKENQLKTTYLIGSIIFCLMCILVIVFFIQSRRRSKIIMTNMANHNDQLKLALSALEERNTDFNKLLNILGHDLKNPMTAISNIAELLLLNKEHAKDDVEMFELISSSSRNLIMTINDLLDVGNKGHLLNDKSLEIIDLEELVTNSVALMEYSAREKSQTIHLSTTEKAYVKVNRIKIWRVINNLIVNAIKFSNHHSDIYVSMKITGDEIQVIVADEGVGIPPDLQEKLFDLFTKAKRRGTAGELSFGLGLHTSKQIIEAHNGRIWFKSDENKGSVFYISLPGQSIIN